MESKNGGPAFPVFVATGGASVDEVLRAVERSGVVGLTVLDYFAAKAMQGIQSAPDFVTEPDGAPVHEVLTDADIARLAYSLADAMLAARAPAAQPEQPAQDTAPDPGPKPGDLLAWGSQAVLDVAAERRRQIELEGWAAEHDDEHSENEMALAAACYAMSAGGYAKGKVPPVWPWMKEWWKPSTARRDLVKAGALILAEIERLDRADAGAADQSAPNTDGWIEWRGGECPVDAEAVVDVRLRVDEIGSGLAGEFDWLWRGEHEYADIVAYRVVREGGEE